MKGLEDFRKERYMDIDSFVQFLGIAVATYYRLLKRQPTRFSTMRKVAGKLKVRPEEITEFSQETQTSN